MSTPALCLLLLLVPGASFAAGNVETARTSKGIEIRGDSGTNEFDVTYGMDAMGNDVLVVEGKNGTTVNNQAKFEVALPGGDGKLSVLTILPKEGADIVTVDLGGLPEGKRFDEVNVDGEDGSDNTTTVRNVSLTPRGKLAVKPGTGESTTTVEDCDANRLNVRADGGSSGSISVKRCNVTATLRIEPGASSVLVEDTFYDSQRIKPSTGGRMSVAPSLNAVIRRNTGKKISLQGAAGDDNIVFEDNMIESVAVKLGDGDDLISFTGSSFDKTKVDGGGGTDCFDDLADGNDFGSYKTKGFEPCDGAVMLEYFGLGADPIDEPPADAVAWRPRNPEIEHDDGPFALPGAPNPLALPVLDPLLDVAPTHWSDPDVCDWIHLHGSFDGHADPAPGPPATESACGHGALEWGRLVPAI